MFVPVLSRRHAASYESVVRRDAADAVALDDRSLVSRLQALAGDFPEGRRYRDLMSEILGLQVATFPAEDGLNPGVQLDTRGGIHLTRMGDGVRNVVTIGAELADSARPRVMLIEEPENDLHPDALYRLLQVLRRNVEEVGHQLVVSTHSDVVLRELGSIKDAVVYRTSVVTADGTLPTTTYARMEDEFDRRAALHSLGYRDALPIAWLVLEESTAQSFIFECLVPLFVPRLSAIRGVSSDGVGNARRTVDGLHRMILFARLVEEDAPRAWVLVDGDEAGLQTVDTLREAYSTWPADRFRALSAPGIEEYYPARFADQVHEIQQESDRQRKRRLKAGLVKDIVGWVASDPDLARGDLQASAGEVIACLEDIERQIIALQVADSRAR